MCKVAYNMYINQGSGWETISLQLLGGVLCLSTIVVTCDCDIHTYLSSH